ncbi:MAG: hypothetical protein Q4G03_08890 [Planctomycetia bacterium]|nr:hypothetical protein [Planctomycetia bacterium]
MKQVSLALALLLCCAACMVGCGKSTIKTEGVTGKITLDGQPLANCNVIFKATDSTGSTAGGLTDETGVYKLQTVLGKADAGTTPGEYQVFFTCDEVVQPEEVDDDGNILKEEIVKSAIPKKYNSPETSGFTATVVKGSNTFDFDLVSK